MATKTTTPKAPKPVTLKDKLLEANHPLSEVERFLAYVFDAKKAEENKDKKPVSSNSDDMLYSLFTKYRNLGLVIDGVNVVITGRNMAMVTFHGYKNKVLETYPEAKVDMGLVREGDTFTLAKESGGVLYSHSVADPFGNKPIIGAYVVFITKRGEFVETLNKDDFGQMKKGSKMQSIWDTWASEFWLKSVIKRACKRHFYDIVAEIDKIDNEDYGLAEEVKASKSKKAAIIEAAKDDKADGNSTQS